MAAKRAAPQPASVLSTTWCLAGATYRVANASHVDTKMLDERWGPQRPPSDAHDWSWQALYEQAAEIFVVLREDQSVAAWASWDETPRQLPSGLAYRLDFFEVDPARRGDGITAAIGIAVVATRALELGAASVVLGSLPDSASFYQAAGAMPGKIHGWKTAADLLPYRFDREGLDRLAARLDENRQEDEEEG